MDPIPLDCPISPGAQILQPSWTFFTLKFKCDDPTLRTLFLSGNCLESFTLVLQAAGARVTFSVSQTRWPPPPIEACRPGLLCISSLPQYRGRSSDHRPQCQCQRNANMNTSEPTLSGLFSGHHHQGDHPATTNLPFHFHHNQRALWP